MTTLKDYWFDLPENLIAQNPAGKRDESRLMIIDRKNSITEHRNFYNIADYLNKGDVLVVNESKVFPARLAGKKENTGASVEFLLLENKGGDVWEIIMKPGRKGRKDAIFSFGNGILKAKILQSLGDGNKLVEFYYDKSGKNFFDILSPLFPRLFSFLTPPLKKYNT